MALITCEGIVLKTHALGDTSRIVTVYTRDHGLRKFVAKGARKLPSRFGYALEPLSRSRFVFYMKPDRDLHLLSKAEVLDALGSRLSDLSRLAHAQAALELVDRLVWGEEPHPRLFALLAQALEGCTRAPIAALPAVTLAFQLQLAAELGYRPRLDQCAIDGRPVSQRRAFSPSRGGLLCDTCAGREGGVVFLSAEALASLALLLSRPVLEAGDYIELPRAGELMRVIEDFFRTHFQRFVGLRALDVLRGLEGPGVAARAGELRVALPAYVVPPEALAPGVADAPRAPTEADAANAAAHALADLSQQRAAAAEAAAPLLADPAPESDPPAPGRA
ncbi:MAG: DNA repair protein RecO [Candidatus Eisenbacteria bacterium]